MLHDETGRTMSLVGHICFLILPAFVISLSDQLPHPSCSLRYSELHCKDVDLELPTTFDVDKVPADTVQIVISCPLYESRYCHKIHDNLQPFPYRSRIQAIVIHGFTASARRIPVNELFQNFRQTLAFLAVQRSRIGYLDANFLRGFSALTELWLSDNDISSIEGDSFQSLIYSGIPGEDMEQLTPKVRIISLGKNALESLDWSVFQDVATSLETIYIAGQKPALRSLRRSGPDFNLQLRHLDLSLNNLTSIPTEILDTIAASSEWGLDQNYAHMFSFAGNSFCLSAPDCSCCEVKDFMEWLASIHIPGSHTLSTYTCGGTPYSNGYLYDPPPNWNSTLHSHCSPVTSSLPTERTTTSTINSITSESTPEIDTVTALTTTSTAQSASPTSSCACNCDSGPPLVAYCTKGSIVLPLDDLQNSDAVEVQFVGDKTFPCRLHLRKIHFWLLENRSGPGEAPTEVVCNKGQLQFSHTDPDKTESTSLVFRTTIVDLSCRNILVEFVQFILSLNTSKRV